MALYFLVLVIATCCLSIICNNQVRRNQIQQFLASYLKPNEKNSKDPVNADKIFIAKGLDVQVEGFFEKVINKFISDWYLNVTKDHSFIDSVRTELASGLKKIAWRYKNVDYADVIATKLLPIMYTHFSEIENLFLDEDSSKVVEKFLENNFSIHPATFNKKSELQYLRSLSETLIPLLCTSKNYKCLPALDIVRELLANMLLLPLTDIFSDPNTINSLVILATNPRTSLARSGFTEDESKDVELLANFVNSTDDRETRDEGSKDERGGNDFFKDHEKLYNFMHFLRNKSIGDLEILKFVLDVDHQTAELEKYHQDPVKVSELSSKLEALLKHYRENLFKGTKSSEVPEKLQDAYNQAKSSLESKWKHGFYKSAEFYKLTYGDRDAFNTSKPEKEEIAAVGDQISSQKLSTKIRNAMAMKAAVDGIEEADIQVWDALDVAVTNSPSYYNSMAVKLRRERGQDLENFMQALFHSIEQEADLGEDISAILHAKNVQRNASKQKLEIYQNLFNLPMSSHPQEFSSFVKTPQQSLLYFLAKIIKIHPILLRIVTGCLQLLPDSNSLVLMAIRKLSNRLISQEMLARLIKYLQTELFESKSRRYTQQEMIERKDLACQRLDKLKNGLSSNLKLLQNPILNKHLVYSLLDVILIEAFPELNPHPH